MTPDEWSELMEEPPGGENHGRVRTSGGWRSFEPYYGLDLEYVIEDPLYGQGKRNKRPADTIPHGTLGGYTNHECRCDPCRAAKRSYERRRRV